MKKNVAACNCMDFIEMPLADWVLASCMQSITMPNACASDESVIKKEKSPSENIW